MLAGILFSPFAVKFLLTFLQIIIWSVIPALQGTVADNTKNALRLIIMIQLIPRIYPLTQQLGKSSSKMITETAMGGAAYNLLLYMLISHVSLSQDNLIYVSKPGCLGLSGIISYLRSCFFLSSSELVITCSQLSGKILAGVKHANISVK